jgi:outer membrane receptor protein involved in Fe transport
MKIINLALGLMSGFGLLGLSSSAFAAEPAGVEYADDDAVIEEVLVTARKREESILDIPESVTAISGFDIAKQGIKGLDKIGLAIPNLNLAMRADGYPNVSIRGIGAFGLTQGVGFYLDDVQLFSDASSRFGDLERIEVLKGPQGTLYGGSNIGGAVKFISKRPDFYENSGRIKVQRGGQDSSDWEGSGNIAISDQWAARIFAFKRKDQGFLVNPNSAGQNQPRDVGAYEEDGYRLSVAGLLSDRLSVYASHRSNEYGGPVNNWARELGKPGRFNYDHVLDTGLNPTHNRKTDGTTLELTLETDGIDITYIGSYTDTESTRITDVDLTPFWFFNTYRPEEMDIKTQEIRLTSTSDSNFQWLAGYYNSSYENKMNSYLHFAPGMVLDDADFKMPFELREETNTHSAFFGNASYEVGAWKYDLGLRIDNWKEDEDNLDADTNSGIHSAKAKGTETLPRLSITRNLDNSIVYLTSSMGYEPGGLNGLVPYADANGNKLLQPFGIEKATQHELGWKGSALDGRGTASVAAFVIDYRDRAFQVLAPNPAGPGLIEYVANIGDTEQKGLEAELTVRVTEFLQLSLAGALMDAKWASPTVLADGTALSGKTPSNVIDNSFLLAANYARPLPMFNGVDMTLDVQWSRQGQGQSMPPKDPITNPGYDVVNLQLGITRGAWDFLLSVDNLFDEDYYTDLENFANFGADSPDFDGDGPATIVIGTFGQPRIASASLTYNF